MGSVLIWIKQVTCDGWQLCGVPSAIPRHTLVPNNCEQQWGVSQWLLISLHTTSYLQHTKGAVRDAQIIFFCNFHICLYSPRPSPSLPWKFDLRERHFKPFTINKIIEWWRVLHYKQLHFGVLRCDLITYTALLAIRLYKLLPFLVPNQFKVLCILQTVNFQGKVCHLLLAAGHPGKCR